MSFNPAYPFDLPLLPLGPQRNGHYSEAHYFDELKVATRELGELKGYCVGIPNPMLLLSPSLIKESLASSEIENIHTTVESVLRNQVMETEQVGPPEKEVIHYGDAIKWGFEQMPKVAISSRLVTGIALQLGVAPHGYRTTQNALEAKGGQVVYTPPPAQRLSELLSNWENFVNESPIDPLIKAAVAHYQFEAIHPFGDGNGRTGRILMVLQLINDGVLDLPVIYISGYINKHKAEYYRLLREVSQHENWVAFIRFMLRGFAQQAVQTKKTLLQMMTLFREQKAQLKRELKEIYSTELLESLFSKPIMTATSLSEALSIHRGTSAKYLAKLKQAGVLESMEIGRYHFYIYRALLDILNSD
jgi:Fic family protein